MTKKTFHNNNAKSLPFEQTIRIQEDWREPETGNHDDRIYRLRDLRWPFQSE